MSVPGGVPGPLADPYDVRLAQRAVGLLRTFNEAGVLSAADVQVAARLGRLGEESGEPVQLAAALAVRAVRLGSVCLELAGIARTVTVEDETVDVSALPWPEPTGWAAAVTASPLVATGPDGDPWRPLRFVEGLLYLDRYWRQEELVRLELDGRAARPRPAVDAGRLRVALARLFPGAAPDRQRLTAAVAALSWGTVLAGGPGTGKTTTVARLLAVLADQPGDRLRIALAAPTGKAAARLQEAVAQEAAGLDEADRERLGVLTASTLHRLLGWRPDSRSRFRHDRHNRLPFDVVVVDETSMVSLTLMSRLVEAVRPDARLILVGDPDQLASVEAGAVLGDLVARPPDPLTEVPADLLTDLAGADLEAGGKPETAGSAPESPADVLRRGTVRLRRTYRYGGAISELARAVQAGDADAALEVLTGGDAAVRLASPDDLDALHDDVVVAGRELTAAARAGSAERALELLGAHRLLCAHREGPYGVAWWTAEVERWLAEAIPGYGADGEWYRGRPLLATTNDYELRLYNGDTGVVVDAGGRGVTAAFARGDGVVQLSPSRLSGISTVHAMTVHRSQGSQYRRITLLLPPAESPLLTRELLYTAVTRAREGVAVVGTQEAVAAAVERPIVRASGLRRRRTAVRPD